MKQEIRVSELKVHSDPEIAERKGKGHPDTICDHIAEAVSVALSRYYLQETGSIQHHNVDKALLVGGSAEPAFAGGKLNRPMELYIAGRVTSLQGKEAEREEEIAVETARNWIRHNLRYVDPQRDVLILPRIRSGSTELKELFARSGSGIPRSNDTSIGAGYWPLSSLEKTVLDIETRMNQAAYKERFPFAGEDIKVMGTQWEGRQHFTVAVAMVGRHLVNLDDYIRAKNALLADIADTFRIRQEDIHINAADEPEKGSVYLTVTGCSAENGDDGQVGRGNRVNGLITPHRPMSLEASAGKNPVSHVGKLYNIFAMQFCRNLVESGKADAANLFIVSSIGSKITEPSLLDIQTSGLRISDKELKQYAQEQLEGITSLWKIILEAERPFELYTGIR